MRVHRIFLRKRGEPMRRVLLVIVTMLSLGCLAHEYRDSEGHPYRHARWHDEDVYRREDGHWYARHNNDWVLRPEVRIDIE